MAAAAGVSREMTDSGRSTWLKGLECARRVRQMKIYALTARARRCGETVTVLRLSGAVRRPCSAAALFMKSFPREMRGLGEEESEKTESTWATSFSA
ncbi:hypothetical protein MTO96_000123 [Rhipicephalus appendiculatus]